MANSLSELRTEYDNGRMDRKMLEGLIFQYLLDNYERYRIFKGNRDRWGDFVSWLYPRLSRAVDYYRDTGSTFDAYIHTIVKWSSKEYRAREAEHYTIENVCWRARAQDLEADEAEPNYLAEYADQTALPFSPQGFTQRQILLLLLKSYFFVSDDFLDRAADAVGLDRDELRTLVERLHKMREKREETILIQRQRLHNQYYRCLTYQKRLTMTTPGTARHENLKNLTERAFRRYHAMKKRARRTRMDATNIEISQVLNIPKGTIDSAFYYIRKKTRNLGIDTNSDAGRTV